MPFAKAAQTKLMNSREIVIGLNIRAGVCHRHLSVGNRPAKMAKRKSTRMFRAVDNFMVVAASVCQQQPFGETCSGVKLFLLPPPSRLDFAVLRALVHRPSHTLIL